MENIKLEEGLIDKIKQILKNKKSDTQAIQDISDIIDFAPVIWGDDDDKPKKQGLKIRVDEAKENKEKCVLCGKEIEGYGNNPAPLADEGKCCDSCNTKRVIPARLKAMKANRIDEDNKSLTEDSAEDCNNNSSSSTNLQECDQFEYDDDYMIDYEDESEEEMEYDDDYSFRR